MIRTFTYAEPCAPELAKQRLAQLMGQACRAASKGTPGAPIVLRAEVRVEPLPALAWLSLQRGVPRTYWSDRNSLFEAAGLGAADAVCWDTPVDYGELFCQLRTYLSPMHPNLRYYGGTCFSVPSAKDSPWHAFGSAYFVLPRVELVVQGNEAYLACNMVYRNEPGDLARILAELAALRFPQELAPATIPAPRSREDRPQRAGWDDMVQRTLATLSDGTLEKVVLARESFFVFPEQPDPVALLAGLVKNTERSYHFCFQPTRDAAFIGASPERLYLRMGRRVLSEAVAGTRPRGDSPEGDAALGEELLHCDKELREHRFVVDAMYNALEETCQSVRVDEAVSLLRLRYAQHLLSKLDGSLSEGRTDADLLAALHPTPAVGGHPTREAVEWIAEVEPFDRGWYAGPVGWVGHGAAEFAVAIRSALVAGDTVSLYSGAGIVAGSTPEGEWDEIEYKMGNFLTTLAGHDS